MVSFEPAIARPRHRRTRRDALCAAGGQSRRVDRAAVRRRAGTASRRTILRQLKQLLETGEVATTLGQTDRQAQPVRSHDPREANSMRAVCWHGVGEVRVEQVPDPSILNPRDAIVKRDLDGDLRLGPAPVRRLHSDDVSRRHSRPRVHGRGRRSRAGRHQSCGRRPRRRAVSHRLRQLFLLRARAVLAVRELQSERAARREDVGPFAGRHLRLLAHARRLRRRPGRVRARAVRRRRPAQGAARR